MGDAGDIIPYLDIGDVIAFQRVAIKHYGVWLGNNMVIHVTVPGVSAACGSSHKGKYVIFVFSIGDSDTVKSNWPGCVPSSTSWI